MANDIAHIESIITIRCCCRDAQHARQSMEDSPAGDFDVTVGSGELAKLVCHLCGREYSFGVMVRTAEESRASEVFEEVATEKLDEIGVDRSDFEPSIEDVAMCAGCDAAIPSAQRAARYCRGCNEYVCAGCRKREPRRAARHQADEHWQQPKFAEVSSERPDDGSTFDAEDFIAGEV
jgi:hypothetical protein